MSFEMPTVSQMPPNTPNPREQMKVAQLLAIEVPKAEMEALLAKMATVLGIKLEQRSEFHLTLVGVKNAKLLKSETAEPALSDTTLNEMRALKGSRVEIVGIGTIPSGSPEFLRQYLLDERKKATEDLKYKAKGVTVFAVVKLPDSLRVALQSDVDRYNATEPNIKKHLSGLLHPHITLGFSDKDRFDGDKIVNTELPVIDLPTINYDHLVQQQVKTEDENGNPLPTGGNQVMEYKKVE